MSISEFDLRIRELARQGQVEEAKQAIRAFLATHTDLDSLLEACNLYWALKLPREAILALKLNQEIPTEVSTSDPDGKRLLWGARFFNNAGASRFALQLAEQIVPATAQDHWYLALIYHSNWEDQKALKHATRVEELVPSLEARTDRFLVAAKSTALAALGRHQEAISLLEKLRSLTPERNFGNQLKVYHGICLAQAGRNDEAFEILSEVSDFARQHRESPDYAALCKWLGYLHCLRGEKDVGEKYFEEAHEFFFTTTYRFEPWLDFIALKRKVLPVPQDWIDRMIHYPGHLPAVQSHFGQKTKCWFGSESAELRIHLDSHEVFANSKWHLGIPKELILLAHLRIVGDWGLNSIHLTSLLWPDEVYSFPQLEDRLKKLVQRLRTRYQIGVNINSSHLSLDESSMAKVSVLSSGGTTPSLLLEKSLVKNVDVEKHYDVSRAQAVHYLGRWVSEGLLAKVGAGRNTHYVRHSD